MNLFTQTLRAGGWLDLSTRKLRVPPSELLSALNQLSRTADFSGLPGISK